MPVSFDSVLGIHERALNMQGRRAELLGANLANADTPGYKARDIDFKSALQGTQDELMSNGPLRLTHKNHIQPDGYVFGMELLYRQPMQASLDGNSVESQVEMAAYSENAMRYLTSLKIVGGRLDSMVRAFRGE